MKKENLLSKAEMKKIKGGDPAWVWYCEWQSTIYCYENFQSCLQFCPNSEPCFEAFGSTSCP